MVSLYGTLGLPPLYPGYFNASGTDTADGWATFGELYVEMTNNVKLTAGLRYNEDHKEVKDSSVLFNAVDVNALVGGFLGPDPFWSREFFFLFGGPYTELVPFYGVEAAFDAAALTPPFSDERLAASRLIPIVPGFGETRDLTNSPSKDDWSDVTGRVGLDWLITENTMIYGFYTRGYKPGGFNPPVNPSFQSTVPFTFDSEAVDAFEIGTKNSLLSGSLVLNGSLFFYRYDGLQIARIESNTAANANIDADSKGLELEVRWSPITFPGLHVDFAYSWLDTEIQDSAVIDTLDRTGGDPDFITLKNIDPGANTGTTYIADIAQTLPWVDTLVDQGAAFPSGGVYPNGIPALVSNSALEALCGCTSTGVATRLDGNSLPNSPEHTVHLGTAYSWLLGIGTLTARWDYYWQDDMYGREFNRPGDEIDAWDQHNASLTYQSLDGRWMIKGWIRNIEDEDNVTGHYLTSDSSALFRNYFLTEPRIYGASVRFAFGAN
jgi:outer membrane receptor protein involved in Fe transport